MKFSTKDFFSKYDQILRKLLICSHILKKFLMKNFIFCVVKSPGIMSNYVILESLLLALNIYKQYLVYYLFHAIFVFLYPLKNIRKSLVFCFQGE